MSNGEFFPEASEWPKDLSRRSFLEMAAASLALAGFTGCTRLPLEKIIPYVKDPDNVVPGKSEFYSTAYIHAGMASGIIVESHMGRPTKIEGNPLHPANLGAASAQQQAYILSLYDPDRSSRVLENEKKSSWEKCKKVLLDTLQLTAKNKGAGLYIVSEFSSSPTFEDQMLSLQNKYPEARWIQYEPLSHQNCLTASENVFGKVYQPIYHFDQAETVICFDADIFGSPLFPLRYAQDFIKKRRASETKAHLASLFVFETSPSITGAWSSNRFPVRSREMTELARELQFRIDFKKTKNKFSAEAEMFLQKIVNSLSQGPALFVAGEYATSEIHEICHHLNFKYGNEQTVTYLTPEGVAGKRGLEGLKELSQDLQAGKVESLLIFGGNPAYNSPASLKLAQNIKMAKKSFRFSVIEDETSAVSQWHVPLVHSLETWSDGRSFDGTISLVQPLIAPLFEGKSPHSILALFLGTEISDYEAVQNYWKKRLGPKFDELWKKALQDGFISGTQSISVRPLKSNFQGNYKELKDTPQFGSVEIIFRADETIFDGRFANNPWLQELPKYLSKLTWENAAIISPRFATKNNIVNGQYLLLETEGGSLKAPAWILSGQNDSAITLSFGYGRTKGGKIAKGRGYDAYKIWDIECPEASSGKVTVLKEYTQLASTQSHFALDGNIVKPMPLKQGVAKAPVVADSFYPKEPIASAEEAWAMVIDLDSCIGCSACTLACQSENNIPVVGKEGVLRGREMHWIRIDVYYSENSQNLQFTFQPVPCMHCEKAPCELVCPVGATTHSTDGLNQMVYNRCIGTRYCSNNCPYKVRRFNFLSLNSGISDLEKMQKNPEVSVRPRGVMEKCTYCVQRIQAVRIEARKEKRGIRDGEIKTACQATCPVQAITFGNKNDLRSKVSALRQSPRHYLLLEELGTIPRTTYLEKISEGESHA